jgi:hypothetical protein
MLVPQGRRRSARRPFFPFFQPLGLSFVSKKAGLWLAARARQVCTPSRCFCWCWPSVDTFWPDPEETLMDECRMRWTGVYVVLYAGDEPEPTHLGIFGYSGD